MSYEKYPTWALYGLFFVSWLTPNRFAFGREWQVIDLEIQKRAGNIE